MKAFFLILLVMLSLPLWGQEVLIIFSDSPDGDELVDASWGYRKSPSTLELAGNNDKFPVERGVVFYGAHSLRLKWQSKAGGDWGMAIASRGWKAMDFTQYDSLVYWMNAPESISAEQLPDIALEDMNNNKSKRLALGTLIGAVDGDVNTWQKVSIPLTLFMGGSDVDFSKIKTLFHYQKAADGNQHTLFLDEIRVIKKGAVSEVPPAPTGVSASGYDSRIDITWQPVQSDEEIQYFVYGADAASGPFERLTKTAHEPMWYSDFFGENGKTRYYYVTSFNANFQESKASEIVSATSVAMNEEELLTSIQEAAFRYFYDYAHPASGLVRERTGSGNTCTSGGTGFGLMHFPLAVERGFINREDAAARVLKILKFLRDKASRFHGAWSHWINGETGETIPFSQYDDGADIVETAYLVQGLLTVRQYFNAEDEIESQIYDIATALWHAVDWSWFRKESQEMMLYWHWSPNHGWKINMPVRGFNETMITYILAMASPTHSVPKVLYNVGWAGSNYRNGNTYYGIKQFVGPPKGGPLFFTHYSYLGLNPHLFTDQFCNYFENNRNISLIHWEYARQNPKGCKGYGDLDWGLTASDDYRGYSAHSPTNDNCTITPTAAVSAMPYTPEQSIATLKHFYYDYGERLWGEFGFRDAFNLENDWFAHSVLAIDQGTMAIMIENYRTGLIWDLFMSNQEIIDLVDGFTDIKTTGEETPRSYQLQQNVPNPFNPETLIRYYLPNSGTVSLTVSDVIGRHVAYLVKDEWRAAGSHSVTFDGSNLASGVYILTLRADDVALYRKMLLVK